MFKVYNANKTFFQLYFLFYILLLIAFFFNADPNGGAYLDYLNQKRISQEFSQNFSYKFFNFDKETTRHSPILIIFLSLFERINLSDILIRLINLHICIFLPFIVYKIIVLKFNYIKKNNSALLSCLVFLSPTFISLSIWPDSRIYGLLFFCLSLFNYIKFEQKKKFKSAIKCIFWYAIASYFSLNFSVFAIFFVYKFFNFNNKIFYLVIFNIILAFPAIVYIFSLDTIFFFKSGIGNKEFDLIQSLNFSNKILIICSIISFYLIPFYFSKLIEIKFIKFNNLILSILILLFCIPFFDYNSNYSGGGFLLKLSYFVFDNNYFFYIISIVSLIVVIELVKINFDNFIIISLLILSNIQFSIYHKYYDPFLFILFLSIIDLKINFDKLRNIKINYFYFFSSTFLILNLIKKFL